MACSRAAVSVGNLASVARMKGRYGSIRLGRSGEVCTGAQLPPSTRRTASRCTCSCRAMVPTRHFSTVCRRRICATRSGAMVMASPLRHAVTHEAQTQRRGLSLAAAAAGPTGGQRGERGSRGEFLRCAVRRDVGGSVGRYDGGAVVCPCHQWSSGHPRSGTLVRHVMCVVAPAGERQHGVGASAASAAREPCGRATSAGSAARPGAARLHGPGAGTAGRSSGCRGRSGCTERPGRGNARTGTGGRVCPCAPRNNRSAGRIRPSAPHCCGTAFIGTV